MKNFLNKKTTNAFSMAEIIIVVLIIAVAALMFITTIRPNSDKLVLKKLYYNAYRSLSTATYNIQADVEDFNNKLIEEADAAGAAHPSAEELKKFPQSQQELCEKLTSEGEGYINTSGAVNCNAFIGPHSETQFQNDDAQSLKAKSTFVASNGMFYFLTPMDTEGNTIVWVDLTGERGPNTAIWKKEAPADIVPFMITNNGVVVPLGYPTYDIRYLTARITNSDPDVKDDSQVMSFFAAKVGAFNYTTYLLEPLSWNDPMTFINQEITEMIKNVTPDAKCPARATTEYPACTVIIEQQIR